MAPAYPGNSGWIAAFPAFRVVPIVANAATTQFSFSLVNRTPSAAAKKPRGSRAPWRL
jgi:hypothetical protein